MVLLSTSPMRNSDTLRERDRAGLSRGVTVTQQHPPALHGAGEELQGWIQWDQLSPAWGGPGGGAELGPSLRRGWDMDAVGSGRLWSAPLVWVHVAGGMHVPSLWGPQTHHHGDRAMGSTSWGRLA